MDHQKLEPKKWYWVRKPNGTLVPYRLNRVVMPEDQRSNSNSVKVEMFVGSMIQTFSPSQVVAPAEMGPKS